MSIELFPQIEGKTIVHAIKGQDRAGYDALILAFSDGSFFGVREEGQVGYFSCHYSEGNKNEG